MDIAGRIVFIRKSNNLTQADFGKKLGVSRDVIFNVEKERVKPKELFLEHLCDIFKVNEEWLLTGKGEIYIINNEDMALGKSIANIIDSDNEMLHDIVNKLALLDDEYLTLIDNLISTLAEKEKKDQ